MAVLSIHTAHRANASSCSSCSVHRKKRSSFRKSIFRILAVLFILYVIFCLETLRSERLDVQVVFQEDFMQKRTPDHPQQLLFTSPIESSTIRNDSSLSLNASLSLADIHISVKTSKKFHRQRLDIILKTWFQDAPKQTYIVSDDADEEYFERTGGHLVDSGCSSSHNRKALCCKMAAELDIFIKRDKSWFCHFDDDNYVHIGNLAKLLAKYDFNTEWYLGKPSIKAPLEISYQPTGNSKVEHASFWFATGGAGFCLSRKLGERMAPIVSRGKLMGVGELIRLPDDVTLGYVIEYLLKVPLTVVKEFHSHLEPLGTLSEDDIRNGVSFSYSAYRGDRMNRLLIPQFDIPSDPTRFLALHCLLHPNDTSCPAQLVSS